MTYGPARVLLDTTALRTSDAAAFRRNQERFTRHGGGSVYAGFHSVMRESPTIEYTTMDLIPTLTMMDGGGVPNGTSPITAIWSRPADNQIPYASAIARTLPATTRHFLNRISITQGQTVRISATAFGVSPNGNATPVENSTPNPPGQISESVEWVCTSIVQNGVEIERWQSAEIEIDHKATTQADECFRGQRPFPVLVASGGPRGGVDVSLTIEGHDLAQSLNDTDPIVFTLQPKISGQASLGSDEITITIIPGLTDRDLADGSPSSNSITVLAKHDGTNLPITIALPAVD